MTDKSTRPRSSRKAAGSRDDRRPSKPYPGFPLMFHASGRIAKKVRGNFHYFGRWATVKKGELTPVDNLDAAIQEAVDLWNLQRDDLQAGRKPRTQAGGYTLAELTNDYLNFKRRLMDAGELAPRTFSEYHRSCQLVIDAFGGTRLPSDLVSEDFAELRSRLATTRGPVNLGNEIQRVRMLFKWAFDEGKIETPNAATFRRSNW